MWEIFLEISFSDFCGIIFLGILLSAITLIGFEALMRFLNDLF